MKGVFNVFSIGSNNTFQIGLQAKAKEGDVLGYVALFFVLGPMVIILYLLIISTFFIRKLIAPEYPIPQVSLTTHKYILIGIGIVYLIGFVLYLVKLVPAILAVLCLYLFFRYVCPFIWKRLLA